MPGTPVQHPLDGAPYFSDGVDHIGHAECPVRKPSPRPEPSACVPLPAGTPVIRQRLLERAYHLGYRSVEEMAARHPGGGGARRPVDEVHSATEIREALAAGPGEQTVIARLDELTAAVTAARQAEPVELLPRRVPGERTLTLDQGEAMEAAAAGAPGRARVVVSGAVSPASVPVVPPVDPLIFDALAAGSGAFRQVGSMSADGVTEYPGDRAGALVESPTAVEDESPVFEPGRTVAEHARFELEQAGAFAEDPRWAAAILAAVGAFMTYGHSGGSHGAGVDTLRRLLFREPLSPLTSSPREWHQVTPELWQNRRDSRAMSTDGGRSWYFVEGRNAGERCYQDGVLGKLVDCPHCQGSGLFHLAETEPAAAVEVVHEVVGSTRWLDETQTEQWQAAGGVGDDSMFAGRFVCRCGEVFERRAVDGGVRAASAAVEAHIVDPGGPADPSVMPKPVAPAGEPVSAPLLVEMAWGLLANVSEGDWGRQTPEWHAAAVRWRDGWHRLLAARSAGSPREVLAGRLYELYGQDPASPASRAPWAELAETRREPWLMAADEVMLLLGVAEDGGWSENLLTADLRDRLGVVSREWSEQKTIIAAQQDALDRGLAQVRGEADELRRGVDAVVGDLEEALLEEHDLAAVRRRVGRVRHRLRDLVPAGGEGKGTAGGEG